MFKDVALALGVAVLTSQAAQAQNGPVVVELYTSQGCSSCPPADDLLRQMASRDDVIALALHVDYWDYIGWKDAFGSPAFTARQHRYALAANSRMVYTPQFIISGVARIEGARTMDLMDGIRAQAGIDTGITVRATRAGGQIHIVAQSAGPLSQAVLVQLVRYLPQETVSITRGENEGRTLTYANIVTDWDTLGQWTGQAPFTTDVKAEDSRGVVVIVQQPGPGPILAAARLQ
ncbi:MAG: DUF1223 domain-containing protein [Limimaricola sp.]|nr:DUF1223 domain-containing protein [Limimaricola sp.]